MTPCIFVSISICFYQKYLAFCTRTAQSVRFPCGYHLFYIGSAVFLMSRSFVAYGRYCAATTFCCFLVASTKSARNASAITIPTGYAIDAPIPNAPRDSGAFRKYVADTALMKVAGTAVIQNSLCSRYRYMLAVHSTIIASV